MGSGILKGAHQLADVLLLPPQCTVRFDLARLQTASRRSSSSGMRPQVGLTKRDEFLAEFLQGEVFTLSLAFTGLCIVHRLKYLPRSAAIPGPGVYHVTGRLAVSQRDSSEDMGTLAKRESLDRAELENLVELALNDARQRGVDQAEAAASQDTGLSATARLGDVESLEYTNDRGIGITVFKGSRKGNASTSDMSPAAIREAVAKACTFATLTAEDEFAGLADAELMCSDPRDLDLDHPWGLDAEAAIALAIEAEAAGLQSDKRISNSEGATVSTNRGTRAYGNTHGFMGSFSKTSHSITCVVLAEADGVMQRDYHYTSSRSADDLEAAADVGRRRRQKRVSRLGARKIKTTRAPVLYIPELRARVHRARHWRDRRRCAVSAFVIPARCRGRETFSRISSRSRNARTCRAHGERGLRWRGCCDLRSRYRGRRRIAGLRAQQLFSAPIGADDDRQCGRNAEPDRSRRRPGPGSVAA